MGKLEFKIDMMSELKKCGYNPQRLRNEKILSQSTLTNIRKGIVPAAMLLTLCELTGKQPGTLIKYVPDDTKIES